MDIVTKEPPRGLEVVLNDRLNEYYEVDEMLFFLLIFRTPW